MLGNSPIGVVLLAKDLDAARAFYRDEIGLTIDEDSDSAVTFRCAGETSLTVTSSTVGTKDEQTQASWKVTDLRAEVAELAERGVTMMDIDSDGIKTENGIADVEGVPHAWFADPAGNTIGIEEAR